MRANLIVACALGALAAGCIGGQSQTETLVRQVTIEGQFVVLERCRVRAKSDVIAVGRCWRETKPLPVVTRVERAPAPAPCDRPAAERPRWRDEPVTGAPGVAEARAGAAAAITPGLRD